MNTKCALCTAVALLMLPASAIAQSKDANLEKITVTATKSEQSLDNVSATVDVITAYEIEKTGAANLKDVLEKTPGLTLQYGTFPSASSASKSSVSIRGIGASGTLILINGKRVAGEAKNPYELDRIPAAMIERIEIIKGPMSVLYGADATGGILNIITKQPSEETEGSVAVRGGSTLQGEAGTVNADAFVQGKYNRLGYSLYASGMSMNPYRESETAHTKIKTANGFVSPSKHPNAKVRQLEDSYDVGVTYREEAETTTLGGRLSFDLASATTLGVDFSYFDEERDGNYRSSYFPTGISISGKRVPVFDTPVHSQDENWRRDLGADLSSELTDDLKVYLRAYNSYYQKRNTTTALNWRDAGFSSQDASKSTGMNADVDIMTYEGFGTYSFNDVHVLTVGGEYREEERTGTLFNMSGDYEKKNVEYSAAYIQDEWKITDSLRAIFGARYDDISNADSKATFKAGLINTFHELLTVRANFAQGYRAPDIRELYIFQNTPAGSLRGATITDTSLGKSASDINPEFVNAYELGVSGKSGGFNYSVALFYNDIEDKIDQVTKNPGTSQSYYTYENVSQANTKGLELSTGYTFDSGFAMNLDWYELDTENENTHKPLEFSPEREVIGTISYTQNGFEAWISEKYTGRQYALEEDDNWIDPYFLTDIGMSYVFGDDSQYKIYAGMNNVLNEKVDTLLGSNVGQYVYTGIRYYF